MSALERAKLPTAAPSNTAVWNTRNTPELMPAGQEELRLHSPAGLVRIEYVAFVLCLLAVRRVFVSYSGARPASPGFLLWFAALATAAIVQVGVLYGAYAVL